MLMQVSRYYFHLYLLKLLYFLWHCFCLASRAGCAWRIVGVASRIDGLQRSREWRSTYKLGLGGGGKRVGSGSE